MERYRDMTIRKKSNLKMLRNLILFIALIIFTFWYIFKDQDIKELITTIKSVNLMYIIIGAGIMLLVYLTESYNVRNILVALGEKKLSLIKALKFTWIGFFFSAITPAATGGQPVEIYYMTKEKRPDYSIEPLLHVITTMWISNKYNYNINFLCTY